MGGLRRHRRFGRCSGFRLERVETCRPLQQMVIPVHACKKWYGGSPSFVWRGLYLVGVAMATAALVTSQWNACKLVTCSNCQCLS